VFEIEVEAEDEHEAYASLDEWIADDFDDHIKTHSWDFGIEENE
jgi:hypothetical protein